MSIFTGWDYANGQYLKPTYGDAIARLAATTSLFAHAAYFKDIEAKNIVVKLLANDSSMNYSLPTFTPNSRHRQIPLGCFSTKD
jgi:hypothetical protein